MPFGPDFAVSTERADSAGGVVVRARGELDSGTCDALVEAVHQAIAGPAAKQLILDLAEVTFIDSTGTRSIILLERSAREHGVDLLMVSPPDEVTAPLRIAGVAARVRLAPTAPGDTSRSDVTGRVELELPRDPRSPSRARAEVREALAGRVTDTELANLVLLTSELVTNAVIHPDETERAPIGLRITTWEDGVRVEVEDSGQGFDPAAPVVTSPDRGRGLFLVNNFAAKWGARPADTEQGRRFRVWFELDREPATATCEGGR